MKMILAIMDASQVDPVSRALTEKGFRVTRIASTGGFMRRRVVTLFTGVEDSEVEKVLQVIREAARNVDGEKRMTLFVVPVARFAQI